MNLRIRILLVTLVAAVVPVVVVGLWTGDRVRKRTDEQYERQLQSTVSAARRRAAEQDETLRRGVVRLCERDIVVDRLMLDLAANRFGPEREDELVQLLPTVMRQLGLDTLELLDARPNGAARVLAAGQYSGRAGASDPQLLRAISQARDRQFVQTVRVREGGETRDERVLLTGCVAEQAGVRVAVVGGRYLDDSYVAEVAGESETIRVMLQSVSSEAPTEGASSGRREEIQSFPAADGTPAARLVAVVDDSQLLRQIEELDRGFLSLGAVAVALAIGLGLLLSWAVTRPVARLEDATKRVGDGDLESTIGARTGGEFGRLEHAFDDMTRKLKRTQVKLLRAERIAAWRDIARRIAHEIKNPLSPIQTSIETMRKTYKTKHPDFDEIFEESTVTILHEVGRLKRIVTEFSQFARLPAPRPEDLSVVEVVSHVVGLHQGGDVEVTLEAAEDLPAIRADSEQITQVLMNLVQNAADAARAAHGGARGHVSVRVDRDPDRGGVLVSVGDDGPGVGDEERSKVFEPYFTTKAGGTGLGLAIVHRIVTDHGGSVDIGESPLGGAQFSVLLTREGPPQQADGSFTDTAALPLVRKR